MHTPSRPVLALLALAVSAAATTVAFAPAAHALSGTVYVAEGGSNTGNDCSAEASPCGTVNHAQTQVASGGTVRIAGDLEEHVVLVKPITIDGSAPPSGDPATIDGTGNGRVIESLGHDLVLRRMSVIGGDTAAGGGGVLMVGASLTVDQVGIVSNSADGGGGGIASDGLVTVLDSFIAGNLGGTPENGNSGGGILLSGTSSALVVERSRISGNKAYGNGGAVAGGVQSSVAIGNSTIDQNISFNYGGAIAAVFGGFDLRNSTVSGNSAGFGALFLFGGGIGRVTGTTLVDNNGDGILPLATATGRVHVAGSILDNPEGAECTWGLVTPGQAVQSDGYNVWGDQSCATVNASDLVDTSVPLAGLAINGGPTETRMPASGGPADDLVPDGATSGGVPLCGRKDQRGVQSSGFCAAGAVEIIAGTAPAFTSAATKATSSGAAFTHTVVTTGPTPELSIAEDTPLPAGVTFTDNRDGTGTLAGTGPAVGSYPLTVNADNRFDVTAQSFTLTVSQGAQAISFSSTKPTAAKVGVGSYTVSATGGGSGNPVTFSLDPTSTGCALLGARVTFTGAGTCRVNANQAGDGNFLAAPQVQQAFTIARVATRTSLRLPKVKVRGVWYRQFIVRASATQAGLAAPTGKVQIRIGGTTRCTVTLVKGAGTCTLRATSFRRTPQTVAASYLGSTRFGTSKVTTRRLLR